MDVGHPSLDLGHPSIDGGHLSLEGGHQEDLEHTEYSVLPLRRFSQVESEQKSNENTVNEGDLVIKSIDSQVQEVETGGVMTLQCKVEGSKPIDVIWFFGSKSLSGNDRIEITRIKYLHTIRIFDARLEDAGKYSCAAINGLGEKWTHFYVKIKGREFHTELFTCSKFYL